MILLHKIALLFCCVSSPSPVLCATATFHLFSFFSTFHCFSRRRSTVVDARVVSPLFCVKNTRTGERKNFWTTLRQVENHDLTSEITFATFSSNANFPSVKRNQLIRRFGLCVAELPRKYSEQRNRYNSTE